MSSLWSSSRTSWCDGKTGASLHPGQTSVRTRNSCAAWRRLSTVGSTRWDHGMCGSKHCFGAFATQPRRKTNEFHEHFPRFTSTSPRFFDCPVIGLGFPRIDRHGLRQRRLRRKIPLEGRLAGGKGDASWHEHRDRKAAVLGLPGQTAPRAGRVRPVRVRPLLEYVTQAPQGAPAAAWRCFPTGGGGLRQRHELHCPDGACSHRKPGQHGVLSPPSKNSPVPAVSWWQVCWSLLPSLFRADNWPPSPDLRGRFTASPPVWWCPRALNGGRRPWAPLLRV